MVRVQKSPFLRRVFLTCLVVVIIAFISPPVANATDSASSPGCGEIPGISGSTECAQLGALQPKLTITPGVTVAVAKTTPTPETPPRDVVAPVTTTPTPTAIPVVKPTTTIRIITVPTTSVPTTTVSPVTSTPATRIVTPDLTIAPRTTVISVTTTPCRNCEKTPVVGVNRTITAEITKSAPSVSHQVSPGTGIVDSIIGFIGSLLGQKPSQKPDGRLSFDLSSRSINPDIFSTTLTAKDNASRFIEMEPLPGENVYGNNGIGTYSWQTNAITEGRIASSVWQISLMEYPTDRKNWYNPPGMLGMGTMGKGQHEFSVNFTAYLPTPGESDAHWAEKPSILAFSKAEIDQVQLQLAVQQPYNPADPAQSQLNQIIQTQLSAAEQKIDLKLADPATGQYKPIFGSSALQNRQYTGSSQSDSSAAANIAASFANEDFRKTVMREALVLSLPTDQRTVFLRVVLLDENGNVSSFSNTLPVTVGKKKIQLQSPWSGWQKTAQVTPHSQTGGYIQDLDGAFFNGKTYLVGRSDGRIWWGVLDPSGSFSGWTEIPGGKTTHREIAIASFTKDECSPEASTGLITVIQGDDNRLWYNSMNMQGSWMGWTEVPGGIITEYGPNLNIASKGIYRHIILTAKKSNTNQYVFNEPPILDSMTILNPGGYWVPNWGSWAAIPAPPCIGTVPEGLPFVAETIPLNEIAANPKYEDNYLKQYRFVTTCTQTNGQYQKGHVYYVNGTTEWTNNGGLNTLWSEWTEVPGNIPGVTEMETGLWNDALWLGARNADGEISVTRLDALGTWLPWATITEKYPTSMYMPALVDGDRPRLIGPVLDQLYVNTLDGPQLLFSKELNPNTYWSMSNTHGEFTYCHRYFKQGGLPVPFRDGNVIASWAGKQKDGQLVLVQLSRIPFKETVVPNESVTFDSVMRTPGAVGSWIIPISPEYPISGKPSYVDPVHLVPFAMNQYTTNTEESLNLYARAIILAYTDKPGELKGYITPTSHFIYSPKVELKSCEPPVEYPVPVYVPDVTITDYHTMRYPDFSNGAPSCNVISTKRIEEGPFKDFCPAIGTTDNICDEEDEGILDYITGFFGSLIDALESIVNFISRTWDNLKNVCVSLVASAIPGCSGSDWCQGAVSGCLDIGLTAIGVPPSIPNFGDLQNMGADYIAATISESVGVPPEVVKEGLSQMKGAVDNQYTKSDDPCGWKPDPAHQGRPEYLTVTLTNNHGTDIPGGTLYVTDRFTDSRGYPQSVFRTSQPGIPYPAMKKNQASITIPVILSRTVTNTTVMGCFRKQEDGSLIEWTCDGFDGGLNLYDWDKGYGEPHPMYAMVIPDTSVNIANLEAKLGRKYTANSMYYQRLSYGTCPEEFYIKYNYLGRDKDSFTLEATKDWSR